MTIYVSWTEYQHHIELLASKIDASKYQYIAGIARGGLIPAVQLSHMLKIEMANDYRLHDYTAILMVDDIYDTGKTAQWYNTNYPLVDLAMVYTKVPNISYPYGRYIESPEWIVFPWEAE